MFLSPKHRVLPWQKLDWQGELALSQRAPFVPEPCYCLHGLLWVFTWLLPCDSTFQSWASCWWLQETVWNCGGTLLASRSSCDRWVSLTLESSSLFLQDLSSLPSYSLAPLLTGSPKGYRRESGGSRILYPESIPSHLPFIYFSKCRKQCYLTGIPLGLGLHLCHF